MISRQPLLPLKYFLYIDDDDMQKRVRRTILRLYLLNIYYNMFQNAGVS